MAANSPKQAYLNIIPIDCDADYVNFFEAINKVRYAG
jgi:hypothetical protein